jgi:hypothetical protein
MRRSSPLLQARNVHGGSDSGVTFLHRYLHSIDVSEYQVLLV